MGTQEVFGLRVWYDGYKAAPKGWVWIKDEAELKKVLRNTVVGRLSMNWPGESKHGISIIKWMAKEKMWPSQKPDIHSWSTSEGYHFSKLIDELYPGKEQSKLDVEIKRVMTEQESVDAEEAAQQQAFIQAVKIATNDNVMGVAPVAPQVSAEQIEDSLYDEGWGRF